MALSNLQQYPSNLNLIKNAVVFWLEKCLFLWVSPLLLLSKKCTSHFRIFCGQCALCITIITNPILPWTHFTMNTFYHEHILSIMFLWFTIWRQIMTYFDTSPLDWFINLYYHWSCFSFSFQNVMNVFINTTDWNKTEKYVFFN